MTKSDSDSAMVWALTGSDPGEISDWRDWLAVAGTAVVREQALAVLAAGGTWPHPVPSARRGMGAAQWAARMRDLVTEFEVEETEIRPPTPARPLTADERRLLAEVPPHHL